MRAPTAGMSTDDLLRNAYAKEFARFRLGEMAQGAWDQSFQRTSPMGLGGGNARLPQAARQGMNQQQYQVGETDDVLASFNTQLDFGDRLLEMMRKVREAQEPGLADYAKQVALTLGPRLLGL